MPANVMLKTLLSNNDCFAAECYEQCAVIAEVPSALWFLLFSARCVRYCHDVRSFVCQSVCPSETGVHCDHTVHVSAEPRIYVYVE